MDYISLIANVVAIFAGLALYIGISNTKWGKAHSQFQYAIMLAAVLFAVLVGGLIKWLI